MLALALALHRAFALLWSALTLLLSSPPHGFGPAAIGLFALVLYDAGQQGQHITNQAITLSSWPGSRSRVTTAYIGACFAGATGGSLLAPVAWAAGGWTGVCVAGAALTAAATLVASPLGARRPLAAA